ncbi:hypothetical protein CVT25_000776 [Psilocybe cyanescens]|uniref:arginine--tRNA ligase n=1 Tax=Psilocybe cyanescens TaxID=93625 RepID=A0A409XAR3_PSICY|nr:hypothetical protein CVT25_000776 [Psilocybe cyanescens]
MGSGEIAHAGAGGVKFDAKGGVSRVEDERVRGTERVSAEVSYIGPRDMKVWARSVLEEENDEERRKVMQIYCYLYPMHECAGLGNGDTREFIFEMLGAGLLWMLILDGFLFFSALIVSDGLLIWRCFNIWGCLCWVPLLVFVVELGLGAVMVLAGVFTNLSTNTNRDLFNNIESGLTFISLGATVPSAFLIGCELNSSGVSIICVIPSGLQMIFKHMVMLVVDSAAAYPLALRFYVISMVVLSFNVMGSPWTEVRNIYIVFSQQQLHLAQFFKVLELMGFTWASSHVHITCGLVQGSGECDARAGDEELEKYKAEVDPEETELEIGITGVKIQDMDSKRIRNHTINWDRMKSFESDTGPYLQNSHVRLASISRRCPSLIPLAPSSSIHPTHLSAYTHVCDIAFFLGAYRDIVKTAMKIEEPSGVVTFAFQLAYAISSAWDVLIIKGEEDEEKARAKMFLYG